MSTESFKSYFLKTYNIIEISKTNQFAELSKSDFGSCIRFNFSILFGKGMRSNENITSWIIEEFDLIKLIEECIEFNYSHNVNCLELSAIKFKDTVKWINDRDGCCTLCTVTDGRKTGNVTCLFYCKLLIVKHWFKSEGKSKNLIELRESLLKFLNASLVESKVPIDIGSKPLNEAKSFSIEVINGRDQELKRKELHPNEPIKRGVFKSPRTVSNESALFKLEESSFRSSDGIVCSIKLIKFEDYLELSNFPKLCCGIKGQLAESMDCFGQLSIVNFNSFLISWLTMRRIEFIDSARKHMMDKFVNKQPMTIEEFHEIGIVMVDYEVPHGTVIQFIGTAVLIGGLHHSCSSLMMFLPTNATHLRVLMNNQFYLAIVVDGDYTPFLRFTTLSRLLFDLRSLNSSIYVLDETDSI